MEVLVAGVAGRMGVGPFAGAARSGYAWPGLGGGGGGMGVPRGEELGHAVSLVLEGISRSAQEEGGGGRGRWRGGVTARGPPPAPPPLVSHL